MRDLIDRQAAIGTTWEEPHYTDPLNVLTEVRDRIKALPSAQPEIIACGDCKYWICHNRRCGFWNHGVKVLDWCSRAVVQKGEPMSWGIAETAPEIEKIKSESADYLNGLNSCGVIDWSTYNYAFDFYADLLMKAYEQGGKDAQPQRNCEGCRFTFYAKNEEDQEE